ncbi:MAG: hypothetical protein IKQ39_05025 [Oscillospiraceae bacterium]|nr:hypothetical protein [Oscillospiraceae bacterium]
MADAQIIIHNAAQEQEPLPRRDYTAALLRRAALTGSLSAERLQALRSELQNAAAERAAAYTRGRSTTVTRTQAEAFYQSVFCQLDAVLLEMPDDAQAEEALRSQPLSALLEAGRLRTLQLYDAAKSDFRTAYRLTEPYATAFFKELLTGFELFCTKYDARFRAFDTKVEYVYPLLGGVQHPESGVIGTAGYYRALRLEGEFLSSLNTADMREMLMRYAEKFRTEPQMIAENLADLALRHLLVNALAGAQGICVTASAADAVQAQCSGMSPETIAETVRGVLPDAGTELNSYLSAQLPAMAETLHARLRAGTLSGWLAVQADA